MFVDLDPVFVCSDDFLLLVLCKVWMFVPGCGVTLLRRSVTEKGRGWLLLLLWW